MPHDLPTLQHHQLSPFELWVVKKLSAIEDDLQTLLAKPDVTLEVKCCPTAPLPPVDLPPAAPTAPLLGKGDSKTMIEYPVTMPKFVAKDTAKSVLHWTENGGSEQTQDFTTSEATGTLVVNDGAAVEVWATVVDKAGNVSDPSPHVSIASAADTTPPPAPDAPAVGSGQTGDEAPPPVLGKGVKKK